MANGSVDGMQPNLQPANFYSSHEIPLRDTYVATVTPLHEHQSHVNTVMFSDICNHSEYDSDFDDDVTDLECTETDDVIHSGIDNAGFVQNDANKEKNAIVQKSRDAPTFMTFLQAHKQAIDSNAAVP